MPVPSPYPRGLVPSHRIHVEVAPKWRWRLVVIAIVLGWIGLCLWRASAPGAFAPAPRHARYGFVLDGQSPDGERVLEGARMLRDKRIDTLIVSGVHIGGGVYYSMIWTRMLALDSIEKGRVLEMRSACTSTMDEAVMMHAFFRERKIDTAVVITSGFHVWRAASIFEKVSRGDMVWAFQPAPDSRWDAGWTDREGFKSKLMEWTKRASWVLLEQWKAVDPSQIRNHALHGGDQLGALPPPAWKR
jgi:hypothetical protein